MTSRTLAENSQIGNESDSFKDCKQMPSAVIAGEGMDFINDNCAHGPEEEETVCPSRDQQRFQAFRRGQKDVWGISERL